MKYINEIQKINDNILNGNGELLNRNYSKRYYRLNKYK